MKAHYFLLLLIQLPHISEGGAIVEILFYRLQNSHDAWGGCCDFWCASACDHQLDICVGPTSSSNTFSSDACPYTYFKSRIFHDDNDVFFSTGGSGLASGRSNPVTITLPSWSGGLKVKVKITDHDIDNDDDVMTLYTNYWATAEKSVQHAVWIQKKYKVLTIKYKVYCEVNWYGPGCDVFCVAQDDNQNGHYTCNPDDGSKMCRVGYLNPHKDCRTLAGYCSRRFPCRNGGTCQSRAHEPNGYDCLCPDGYTGRNCEFDIKECASDPCINNGTCVEGLNQYKCSCQPEYAGRSCEFHVCESGGNPCLNNGTCYGQRKCFCPPNFTGDLCQENLCDSVNCVHGTCEAGTCECEAGYVGAFCGVRICDHKTCLNGGTCIAGECICPYGYTGDICETNINECTDDLCQNEGTCYDKVGGYTCECLPMYNGTTCEDVIPENNITVSEPWTDDDNTTFVDPVARPVEEDNNQPPFYVIGIILVLAIIVCVLLGAFLLFRRWKRREAKKDPNSSLANFDNPMYDEIPAATGTGAGTEHQPRTSTYAYDNIAATGAVGGATATEDPYETLPVLDEKPPLAEKPKVAPRPKTDIETHPKGLESLGAAAAAASSEVDRNMNIYDNPPSRRPQTVHFPEGAELQNESNTDADEQAPPLPFKPKLPDL